MGVGRTRRWPRLLAMALVEVLALVVLLVLVANLIPLVAPPPTAPTPVVPADAIRDCPALADGCR